MNKLWVIILFGFAVFVMVKARSLYTTNYQVQKANQVGSSNKITAKHDLCSASSSSSSSSSSEESDGCNCNDEGTHLSNQEINNDFDPLSPSPVTNFFTPRPGVPPPPSSVMYNNKHSNHGTRQVQNFKDLIFFEKNYDQKTDYPIHIAQNLTKQYVDDITHKTNQGQNYYNDLIYFKENDWKQHIYGNNQKTKEDKNMYNILPSISPLYFTSLPPPPVSFGGKSDVKHVDDHVVDINQEIDISIVEQANSNILSPSLSLESFTTPTTPSIEGNSYKKKGYNRKTFQQASGSNDLPTSVSLPILVLTTPSILSNEGNNHHEVFQGQDYYDSLILSPEPIIISSPSSVNSNDNDGNKDGNNTKENTSYKNIPSTQTPSSIRSSSTPLLPKGNDHKGSLPEKGVNGQDYYDGLVTSEEPILLPSSQYSNYNKGKNNSNYNTKEVIDYNGKLPSTPVISSSTTSPAAAFAASILENNGTKYNKNHLTNQPGVGVSTGQSLPSSLSLTSSSPSPELNGNHRTSHKEVISKDSSSASSSSSSTSSSEENYDKKIVTANTQITISKIDSNSSSSPSSSSSSSSEENLPFSHSPSFHGDHGHSGESSPSSSSEE